MTTAKEFDFWIPYHSWDEQQREDARRHHGRECHYFAVHETGTDEMVEWLKENNVEYFMEYGVGNLDGIAIFDEEDAMAFKLIYVEEIRREGQDQKLC